MRKKIVLIMLCVLLVTTALVGFVACGPSDGDGGIAIKVWVGDGTGALTRQLINEFNETNEFGIKFFPTIEEVSESVAAGDVLAKKDSAPDIYTFAVDQLARLVDGGMLMDPGSSATAFIEENNDEGSVEATKIGGEIKAYPLTADNGFFMYYDKRVVAEEHIGSLEQILADCKAAGQNFSMNLDKDRCAWYAASFFYATGCVSEWRTDASGKFSSYNDTCNSPEGMIALKGMQKVFDSGCYYASDKVGTFDTGIKSAVVVSGIWDYNAAKQILEENLGVAPLPSFTVDGKSYQLVSFLGRKMLGIKPQKDANMSRYLQALAKFLTNKESQLKRFEAVGWGPSNKEVQNDERVKASVCLDVIARSKTVLQGQYPDKWWTYFQAMVGGANGAKEDQLQSLLSTYTNNLPDAMNS